MATQIGTNKKDNLIGTSDIDFIFGLNDNDVISGNGRNDRLIGGDGNDTIDGDGGKDIISGNDGDDRLDGGNGDDKLIGDNGNDTLTGGAGRDTLNGGKGNDSLSGGKGSDRVNGGSGGDRIIWNEGDGDDIINAGSDSDTVEANYSGNTVLRRKNDKVVFGRIDVKPFQLTIDNAELFEINGDLGNDSLTVNDLTGTDVTLVNFSGGTGNDTLDAANSNVQLWALGGAGDDVLQGGAANDILVGGDGIDTLTGNAGADQFTFVGDVFAGGTPVQASNGIRALARPDQIQDYDILVDRFALDASDLGINDIRFQKGTASEIATSGNVIALTNPFDNAAAAAKAIADNNAITDTQGVFIYFNNNLKISRLVYSKDLGNGGDISVLANLNNQAGATGLANISTFSFNNFTLI